MPARTPAEGPTYKMVLILRGELRLTAGKAAVQAAHAAVMLSELAARKWPKEWAAWRAEGQKKIALLVPTLSELEEIDRAARNRKLPTLFVEDAGLTEVPPGTRTVLGIGPARSDLIDPITGKLPLL